MAYMFEGQNPASQQPSWLDVLQPGAKALGGIAGQAMENRQARKEGDWLNSILQNIQGAAAEGRMPSNTDVMQWLAEAQSQGLRPQTAQAFQKNYLEQQAKGRGGGFRAPAIGEASQREIPQELESYLSSQYEGLTPAEVVKRGAERYKTGLADFEETAKKVRNLEDEERKLNILEKLNESGKLPKDLQRLNVDFKTGNLRLPFLAKNPETERYVKTLNEFTSKAKESFGARVTNFDLDQFLKRLPNLLNTEAGRKQIIEQMKLINELDAHYFRNLRDVYKIAGGVRHIDADVAKAFAEEMSRPQVEEATKKLEMIGEKPSEISEGGGLPGAPEALGRSQRVKPQEGGKKIRQKSSGKTVYVAPEDVAEYINHPDFEVVE